MPYYRKKPVIVKADVFNPRALLHYEFEFPEGVRPTFYEEVSQILGTSGCSKELPYYAWDRLGVVDTLEGKHIAIPGDYIITGVAGEKYPCKPDIFEKTYELVEESDVKGVSK